MEKILISACLLGQEVRYDGRHKLLSHPDLNRWQQQNRLVPLCPEIAGGLAVPRPAAEVVLDGRTNKIAVMDVHGSDITEAFTRGAERALLICQTEDIRFAVLTESSPSCGSHEIYDGTFSGQKKPGAGVAAALLMAHGIQVFNQHQVGELAGLLG